MGAKSARINSWQLSVATLAQVSQSTHGILRKLLHVLTLSRPAPLETQGIFPDTLALFLSPSRTTSYA